MNNKDLFLRMSPIFITYFIYLFVGLAFIQYHGKEPLHLFFNKYNSPVLDVFFKYYTEIGTTLFFIITAVYIFIKSTWFNLICILVTEAIAGGINLIIKNTFFDEVFRPFAYFNAKAIDIHIISNIYDETTLTFPSGHSLMAIVTSASLCLLTKNRFLQLLFSLNFVIIAISRMYLSKHFLIDTLGGFTLGLGIFCIIYYIFDISKFNRLHKNIFNRDAFRNKKST